MRQQKSGRERIALQWVLVCLIGYLPVFVLVAIQVSFLPYHKPLLTWAHRGFVLVALCSLCQWPRILDARPATQTRTSKAKPGSRRMRCLRIVGWLGVAATIAFYSFLIAVIPGERIDLLSRRIDWLSKLLLSGSPNLCLAEKTLVQEAPSPQLLASYYARGESSDAAWREHAGGLDLRNRDLRSADFRKARLVNADLRGADLSQADLDYADLQGANLERATLRGATLRFAKLENASLRDADLRGAELQRAGLEGVDISHANLEGAQLRAARLQGVDLGKAKLSSAQLPYASLEGANLAGAQLQDANLRRAELTCVCLDYAELQDANLRGALLRGAHLIRTKLQDADLSYARLENANLQSAEMGGAVLRYAHAQGAVLRFAKLQGTDLSSAQLQVADLSHALLQGADLRGARLQGANLQGAKLQGANLQAAKLQGAVFDNALLRGADLREAFLIGAKFQKCDLRRVDLRGVSIDPVSKQEWASLCDFVTSAEHHCDDDSQPQARQQMEAAMKRSLDEPSPDFHSANLEGAIYQQAGPFAELPPPPSQSEYYDKLADYLVTLACEHRWIAEGIADRACAASQQEDAATKVFAAALAKALAQKDPEAVRQLNPGARAKLEALISPK